MYKLYVYDWLADKLCFKNNEILIDVGGYHGDFTDKLLEANKVSKALIFEPNPNHFSKLKNKYASKNNVTLSPYALGSQRGTVNFNCSQDDATGSLLKYHSKYHHEHAAKTVETFTVEVTKLDDYCAENIPNDKIGLIKIDTQGFDLEVLKGAENLIREHKPWLVVELNFLPFYEGQASVATVMNWLAEFGYNLGGLFNDHYSGDQWLSFADGVFVPEGVIDKVLEPFKPRLFSQELLQQSQYLKNTCDERLKLIEFLHNEAASRLSIINKLMGEQVKMAASKKSWIGRFLSR